MLGGFVTVAPPAPSASAPSESLSPITEGKPHSLGEDAYAMLVGCILLVIGLVLLRTAGLVTGGIAGLALLASYLVPIPAGILFTLINIPFFVFAWFAMGGRFATKAVLANAGIAGVSALAALSLHLTQVAAPFAAVTGGTLIGFGLLVMTRHGTGVGGTGVLTLWLHRRRGWNIGRTQLAMDVVILLASTPLVTPSRFVWSLVSELAMVAMVVVWHRPGRYTGY